MVHLHSPRTDSLNNLIYTHDTLRLNYDPPRQAANQRTARRARTEEQAAPRTPIETMTITKSIRNGGVIDLNDYIRLTASQPIESADRSKITLTELVDTLKIPVAFNFIRDSVNVRKAQIKWNIKDDTQYQLIVDSMAFTSLYNVHNDSTGIRFKSQTEEFYSIIEITFDTIPCQLIVQILKGEKEEIVKQTTLKTGKVATFDYLPPESYIIKIIYDENENGIWDTGNFLKKIQPEKVEYFYEPEITTHSNVKTELQWSLKVHEQRNGHVHDHDCDHEHECEHDHECEHEHE